MRDIGRILFNQQINEELPHNYTTAKDGDIKADSEKMECLSGLSQVDQLASNSDLFIRYSTLLPNNYHKEIHTPPPNLF